MKKLITNLTYVILILFIIVSLLPAQNISTKNALDGYEYLISKEKSVNVSSSEDSVLTELGRWGEGPCYTVQPVGNYIAVGNGSELQIIDFNIPSNPVLIGKVLTESTIRDMAVFGNYIFKIFPFQVIDVSDPTEPKIVYMDTIGFADTKITIKGNYAYIGDFVGYIYIMDISNPLAPKRLGTMFASGEDVLSITVKENFLYASTWASYLIDIFDISDKNNPKFISNYSTSSSAPFLKIENNFLFEAGASYQGFKIININNAPDLTLTGTVNIGHHVYDITLADTLVYLTGVIGNSLTYWGVLTILNIADTSHPKVISTTQINNPHFGSGPHLLKDKNIYITVGRGLTIMNVDNLLKPKQIGYYATAFETRRIEVKGNYAFIASDYVGLKVVDFSNPAQPKTVGEFITNKSVYDIALAGNTIYLYGDSAFFSIDISVPSNPKKISELTIPAPDDNGTYLEYKKLTVLNHYAFTTFRDSSVTIFNISDPSKMNILGKIKTVARPVKVGVTQSEDSLIIYIAEVDSGLQIYAWVNNSFSMVNKIKENLPIVGLKIRDKNLFLASDAGLNIYDISKNKNPYLISRILVSAGSFPDISISGDYTYMEGDGHLVIINIKDLLNPKEVEDIMYPSRVVTAFGNIVFLGISLNGILILENKLVTSTNDLLTNDLKSTFKLYQNYPNPFNPATTIEFSMPPGTGNNSLVLLKVYDILGKEIRTIFDEVKEPGNYKILFNAEGLPSGVYFYTFKVGEYSETKKFIILK